MGYFPRVWVPPTCITSQSELCVGRGHAVNTPTSTAWSSANRAIFLPIQLPGQIIAKRLYLLNGTVVSGNVDMGLYDAALNRLVSIGSTVQAGTSAPQFFDITDTRIGPGVVYLAVAIDNITATVFLLNSPTSLSSRLVGAFQQATAFPLPSTATPAAIATNLPIAGIEIGRVV
jgi:hypothetical protein